MTERLKSRLTDRDRAILEHVARYRLTTVEVLHRLLFAHQQVNAVTKVTTKLCCRGFLNKYPFYHPRSYFTAGERTASLLGLAPHRTTPLGPQALPTEYATLAYATLSQRHHRRLTSGEVRQHLPWLDPSHADAAHCLDESHNPPVIELVRVDLGGGADHVARKCDQDIEAREGSPQFERLVQQGRFRLVVVTSTKEKASAITHALDGHVWPDGLKLHLAVVPDLFLLTANITHGT